jgi:MerR family copper efflux transcriptional regulator
VREPASTPARSLHRRLPSRNVRFGILGDVREATMTGVPTPDEGSVPAMRIGEVAARTELSLRSLRHWEEVGLLRPSGRSEGGFRLYTEADVERILVIRRMKPLGFSLEEMSAVMRDIEALERRDGTTAADARGRLEAVLADAAERRERLVRQLGMADEFLELLGDRVG